MNFEYMYELYLVADHPYHNAVNPIVKYIEEVVKFILYQYL